MPKLASIAVVVLMSGAALTTLGCSKSYIPNTDVEDTSENKKVISFCEKYRHAVEEKDVGGLLKLASPKIEAIAKAEGVNLIVDREAVVWMDKSIDLTATGAIKSGKIAAYTELRDKSLVEAQSQLDQFAASLSSALSADHSPSGLE